MKLKNEIGTYDYSTVAYKLHNMDSIYQATLFFIIVSLSALLVTGALLIFLRKHSILDYPNKRSSHETPTPRGGGIALISVILLA